MSTYFEPSPDLPECIVKQQWLGRAVVVSVSGTVDMLTASRLEGAIAAALAENPVALVIDLTDVDFLASHGISVLVAAHERVAPRAAFAVVADGPATSRPMRLIGVSDLLALYPTRDEALGAMVS